MAGKMPTWADAGFSTTELIRLVSREHHKELSRSEIPVLKILIEDMGPDAAAVVSAATIAERVKTSRKTVLRALRSLTDKKYIESTRTRGAATYTLNVEKIKRGQNGDKSGQNGPQEGTKRTLRGDTSDHSIESIRDSERVLEREDPAAFDEMIHQTITAFLNGELTDWRGRQAWIEMRRDSRRSAAKRYLRIRRGDCQQCGQEPFEPGYLSGRLCLERERERQTRYRESRRRYRYT